MKGVGDFTVRKGAKTERAIEERGAALVGYKFEVVVCDGGGAAHGGSIEGVEVINGEFIER